MVLSILIIFFPFFPSVEGDMTPFISFLIGLVFMGFGIYLFRSNRSSVVFDKENGFFYKSKFSSFSDANADMKSTLIPLKELHALQLTSTFIIDDNSDEDGTSINISNNGYFSYQLNAVLKSAKRVNIITHGNKNSMLKDGDALAGYLSIPLWNGIRD